ncbi:AAA family ATPase [Exiguobacterium profundum]|uniref:AAA family ATPase n=1 Tax=Exiguobacterium profundum TaxID=307643 RepID=UPI000AB8A218|nr:AAA family ATPase [Exiguobacterium profundum]
MRLVYLLKKKSKHEFEEYKFHDILDICYDEQSNEVILSSFSPDVLKIESYLLGKRENIKGIDVIIGDNGAGKTTLLKTIQSFLDFSQHKFLSDGLLGIFFDDETRSIFHHSVNIKEEIRVYGSDDVTNSNVTTIEQIELNGYVTKKSIIYITESIDRGDFFELESASVFNGSTGSTMRSLSDEHSENSSITNPIARYFLNETSRQLKFIYFFNEKIKEGGHNFTLPFKLPDSLEIKVDNNNVHRSLVELFSSKNHKDTNAVEKATRKISNKIQDTFILRHKKLTLYTMTYENAMINFPIRIIRGLGFKIRRENFGQHEKKIRFIFKCLL